MKVAILAGGLGTRLKEYYPNTIKSLIPFENVPFIFYQLAILRKYGYKDIVICSGYGGEELETTIRNVDFILSHHLHMKIEFSSESESRLGTGGAIRKALPLLGKEFFVIYGDSYTDFDFRKTANKFIMSGKNGLMTIYKNNNAYDKSNVDFDGEKIVAYDKKSPSEKWEYIDYGVNYFRDTAFEDTPVRFDLSLVQKRLLENNDLEYDIISNRFYEIGSITGVREFAQKVRRKNVFGVLY